MHLILSAPELAKKVAYSPRNTAITILPKCTDCPFLQPLFLLPPSSPLPWLRLTLSQHSSTNINPPDTRSRSKPTNEKMHKQAPFPTFLLAEPANQKSPDVLSAGVRSQQRFCNDLETVLHDTTRHDREHGHIEGNPLKPDLAQIKRTAFAVHDMIPMQKPVPLSSCSPLPIQVPQSIRFPGHPAPLPTQL
jgi:hypothetical protein